MPVHPSAALGYEVAASAYEQARPGYAPAAVRRLARVTDLRRGSTVLDVGAGTGKWSRAIATSGAEVICVEPVAAMRSVLVREVPSIHALAATAEQLPFRDERFDVVTMGAAIHWFELPSATAEFVRVLRRGGHLVVARNRRERAAGWTEAYERIIERTRASTPTSASVKWREALLASPDLVVRASESHPNDQVFDADRLVARTLSVSSVAALPDDERRSVLEDVRSLASERPEPLLMRCRTEILVLQKTTTAPTGRGSR